MNFLEYMLTGGLLLLVITAMLYTLDWLEGVRYDQAA